MYSTIKRLRIAGRRKSDADISRDQGISGDLTMALVGRNYVLAICGPSHQSMGPCLFDARVVTISGNRMLFEGVERIGGEKNRESESHMQEWAVEVTLKTPPSWGATHGRGIV